MVFLDLSQVHPHWFVPAHFRLRNHLRPRHPHRDGAHSSEPGHVSATQRAVRQAECGGAPVVLLQA